MAQILHNMDKIKFKDKRYNTQSIDMYVFYQC